MESLLSSSLYSDLIQNPEKNVYSLVLSSYINLRTSSQVERGGKEGRKKAPNPLFFFPRSRSARVYFFPLHLGAWVT